MGDFLAGVEGRALGGIFSLELGAGVGRPELILPEMFPLGSPKLPRPRRGLWTRGVSRNLLTGPLEVPRCPYEGAVSAFREEIAAEKELCSLYPPFPSLFCFAPAKKAAARFSHGKECCSIRPVLPPRGRRRQPRSPACLAAYFGLSLQPLGSWARRLCHRAQD